MPTGVKVIAIFYYIGAALFIILGLISIILAGVIGAIVPFLGVLSGLIFVIFIATGVFEFFIARGLWKGSDWARILVIAFAGLGIAVGLISVITGSAITGLFYLIISGAIFYYMIFNEGVKNYFS